MRIHSGEPTSLAYDGTPESGDLDPVIPRPQRVILYPGVNDVGSNDYAVLHADMNFRRHYEAGIVHFLNDDGATLERGDIPEPEKFVSVVVDDPVELHPENPDADPRARIPGEKDKPYIARMKVLDDAATVAKDVEDYFSLNAEERAAMYPALTPEAKAAVDADKRSEAKA